VLAHEYGLLSGDVSLAKWTNMHPASTGWTHYDMIAWDQNDGYLLLQTYFAHQIWAFRNSTGRSGRFLIIPVDAVASDIHPLVPFGVPVFIMYFYFASTADRSKINNLRFEPFLDGVQAHDGLRKLIHNY